MKLETAAAAKATRRPSKVAGMGLAQPVLTVALEFDMNALAPAAASPVSTPAAVKAGLGGSSSAAAVSVLPADFAALLGAQLPQSEESAGDVPANTLPPLEEEDAPLFGEDIRADALPVATLFGGPPESAPPLRELPFSLPASLPLSLPTVALRLDDDSSAGAAKDIATIGSDDTNKQLKDLASGLEALLGKKDLAEHASGEAAILDNAAKHETAEPAPLQTAELGRKPELPQAPSAINTPLHSTRWSEDFSQKLVWMAKNDLQTAQLSINPGNLGPIEVTLSIGKDSASAHFASPFAEVREALEAALPRLKEMLAEAGVALGQADVGAHSQGRFADGQAQRHAAQSSPARESSSFPVATAVIETLAPRVGLGIGMVDTFA